ncbi:MAG: ABC transporter permease [Hyphomicrobiaceae bacterium]|nr:ABC transporter permease [Hyphomicrobiaceae bacterium]
MMNAPLRRRASAFSRFAAMFVKEFIQLKRDRVTFATMIIVPLMQLLLFGFAINTNPRHLPTAILLQEDSDIGRAIIGALKNTSYFDITRIASTRAEFDGWIKSGDILFGIEIPANFARAVRRGDNPSLLVVADASDPVAAGTALGSLDGIIGTALRGLHGLPDNSGAQPFTIVQQRRYNPAAVTSLNIVPGLLGTILTMTMLIFTSLSVTRELERGTMESLLSMPIDPLQIMLGKITPYIVVGFVQAAIILLAGVTIFAVPIDGSLALLIGVTILFVTATLSVGYTFSTIARNQLQAIQMSMMFFLPNILLSGFMFPFAGMPGWAQVIGQMLPLTHYLRTVRGIMLKGASASDLTTEIIWVAVLTVVVMSIAVTRFRRTLD